MNKEKQTNVDSILSVDISCIQKDIDLQNQQILQETKTSKLHLICTDFTFSLQDRINALNMYYSLFPNDTNDIINKLGSMFIFSSGLKSIEKYDDFMYFYSYFKDYFNAYNANEPLKYDLSYDMAESFFKK